MQNSNTKSKLFFLIGMTVALLNFMGGCSGKDHHPRSDDEGSPMSHSTTGTTIGILIAENATPKQKFVVRKFNSIQEEAALGNGPHLVALAQIMDVSDGQSFGGWMHDNYDPLFNNLERPEDLLIRVQDLQQRKSIR